MPTSMMQDNDRPVSVDALTSQAPRDEVIAAEQSVLGSMMLDEKVVPDVRAVLRPDDFYRPAHQAIAQAVFEMVESGKPVDPVTTAAELERRKQFQRVEGAPYLHTLIATVPTTVNVTYYAEIVRDEAVRRRTVQAGLRVLQVGYSHNRDFGPGALSEQVQAILAEYESETSTAMGSGPTRIGDDLESWLEEKLDGAPPVQLPTGLVDLDAITGLRPGEMVVVAARPSVGKSLLGMQVAIHNAQQGTPVLLFSLEMTKAELQDRLVSTFCKVEHNRIRNKQLNDNDLQRIRTKWNELLELPLYVEDASELTMSQIKATSRQYQRKHNIGMVEIDYLGLVRPDLAQRDLNRERQVAEMSAGTKALAKDLQVPVVLIAQVNRGPEQRADRTPVLSDLRESGTLEADAHQVWLLNRPEAHAPAGERLNAENRPGEVQVIIGKNRGGQTGDRWFAFRPHYQCIADMPQESQTAM